MITLQRPSVALSASYLSFIDGMRKHGEKIWDGLVPKPAEPVSAFVERLLQAEVNPEPGLVPETMFWATTADHRVVGRIALRHRLTPELSAFGGHIGYEVHPEFRRKGVATEMLKHVLQTTRAREIGRILITCAPDNVGSNKTILANGGILAKTAFVQEWQRDTNYYWIELS